MNTTGKPFDEDFIIMLFVFIDDAYKLLLDYVQQHWVTENRQKRRPTRVPRISDSEIMTILISYQLSGYKCFKYYYTQYVCKHLQDYFDLVSYNHFIELTERVYFPLQILCQLMCQKSKKTGIYYIDSTKIQVCHNKRIKQHKVFKGAAVAKRVWVGFMALNFIWLSTIWAK